MGKRKCRHEKLKRAPRPVFITVDSSTMENQRVSVSKNTAAASKSKKRKKGNHTPSDEQDRHIPDFTFLRAGKSSHSLAYVYWLLIRLAKDGHHKFCLVLSSTSSVIDQRTLRVLPHLGYQTLCIHDNLSKSQRKSIIQKFRDASSDNATVILCRQDDLTRLCCRNTALILYGDTFPSIGIQAMKCAFSQKLIVGPQEPGSPSLDGIYREYPHTLKRSVLQKLSERIKIAIEIADLMQTLKKSHNGKETLEADWVRKLAKGSELFDEDSLEQSKKRKKLLPIEQKLQALTQKLYILKSGAIDDHKAAKQCLKDDYAQKLQALGIVTLNALVGTCINAERIPAATQWLDHALLQSHGGDTDGCVRYGASKCSTSYTIRKRLQQFSGDSSAFMAKWKPNPEPSDMELWGGIFGKVCGHNEIVMHELRPFFPQEVLNSRVCSKKHPAPGNQTFDGCLEYLRFACQHHSRCMTLWDSENLIHINEHGNAKFFPKQKLLPQLSLKALQWLMTTLRTWTIVCRGQHCPQDLLLSIQRCCSAAVDSANPNGLRSMSGRIPRHKLITHICEFAIGGSSRLWKQCARLQLQYKQE